MVISGTHSAIARSLSWGHPGNFPITRFFLKPISIEIIWKLFYSFFWEFFDKWFLSSYVFHYCDTFVVLCILIVYRDIFHKIIFLQGNIDPISSPFYFCHLNPPVNPLYSPYIDFLNIHIHVFVICIKFRVGKWKNP